MANKFNSFKDLFEFEIKDLYSAELQLIEALPKMAEAANNPELKNGFHQHLEQTRNQKERLDKLAEKLGFDPKGGHCDAMEGLINEGEEIIKSKAASPVKDSALIAAAQRVEHYEISAYGTVRNYAEKLGFEEAIELIEATLKEEKETDSKLNHLAVEKVNKEASDS